MNWPADADLAAEEAARLLEAAAADAAASSYAGQLQLDAERWRTAVAAAAANLGATK